MLVPAYFAAAGTWMIGRLLPGYHEPIDIALVVVFFATLLILMMVLVYTGWHYVFATRPMRQLLVLVLVGLLIVPVVSMGIAMTFHVQMNNIDLAGMIAESKADIRQNHAW